MWFEPWLGVGGVVAHGFEKVWSWESRLESEEDMDWKLASDAGRYVSVNVPTKCSSIMTI